MLRVVKAYGLIRCRDCRGDGSVNDGRFENTCYNCKGLGGEKSNFSLTDVETILLNYGLQRNDILELFQALLKKQIITQNFKSKDSYQFVAKDYRQGLIDIASVEANTEAVFNDGPPPPIKKENNLNPELAEKIRNMENKMPASLKKKVDKELEALNDIDDEQDDGEEEEEEN